MLKYRKINKIQAKTSFFSIDINLNRFYSTIRNPSFGKKEYLLDKRIEKNNKG